VRGSREVSLAVSFFRRILTLSPFALLLALLLALPAFAATPITGVVTNKTTNKPSAGDDVVLIRLQQGMQVSTSTKTDARGHFTLEVPDDGIHLVRVTHDKATYFRPAPPGTQSVEIDVYNAAAHVKGVTGEADVMRIQTDPGGKTLSIIENFFIKNESNPPVTQFSERPFEFVLPEGAVVEGSAALAPGGMPVQSAPVPLPEKGHYTFLFPIRPGDGGETRFQVKYHVPYSGTQAFSPSPSIPTDTIAIMLPKSMTFKPDAGAPYAPVTEETTAQTYVARSVTPGQALGFTLSGVGELPRDPQNPDQGSGNQPQTPADANAAAGVDANGNPDTTKFGGGMGKPIDPDADHDPWSKYKWWILGGLALLMAAAAGVLLRGPGPSAAQPLPYAPIPAAGSPSSVQQALKEEFFALETDRLQKKISEEEYATHKAALDAVLLRALSRGKDA
jgi:hypothetical protein